MTIAQKFEQLRQNNEKALVVFVTAGDPSLEDLPAVLDALQEGGADVIEVGIPFSDPIADGPTIQASSQRALESGVKPRDVLVALSKTKIDVPVVAMGYYNPILKIGMREFAKEAAESGVNGTIISDLTPEESCEWREVSKEFGLDNVFLTAPTSTDERLKIACDHSTGFVYAVSRTGVTGATKSMSENLAPFVNRVKSFTSLPVCVGFGISSPEHVKEVCAVADGAVVGSYIVDLIQEKWQGGAGKSALVTAVANLKSATKS